MIAKSPDDILSVEFPDNEAASALAKKMARKTGLEVVVTDKEGNEVCRAKPDGTLVPRRHS